MVFCSSSDFFTEKIAGFKAYLIESEVETLTSRIENTSQCRLESFDPYFIEFSRLVDLWVQKQMISLHSTLDRISDKLYRTQLLFHNKCILFLSARIQRFSDTLDAIGEMDVDTQAHITEIFKKFKGEIDYFFRRRLPSWIKPGLISAESTFNSIKTSFEMNQKSLNGTTPKKPLKALPCSVLAENISILTLSPEIAILEISERSCGLRALLSEAELEYIEYQIQSTPRCLFANFQPRILEISSVIDELGKRNIPSLQASLHRGRAKLKTAQSFLHDKCISFLSSRIMKFSGELRKMEADGIGIKYLAIMKSFEGFKSELDGFSQGRLTADDKIALSSTRSIWDSIKSTFDDRVVSSYGSANFSSRSCSTISFSFSSL
jgi:hypothetical protein